MSIHANRRSIWCSNLAAFPANEPPFGKILAYDSRIEAVYVNGVPGEDQFVTPALMSRIRSFGLLACCWFVPRSGNAGGEALKASRMVTNLNPDAVMLDVESHDLQFQRDLVWGYRQLKPGRATDVTFEPRQDLTTVAAPEYLAARMDLFPQLYDGAMRPADPKHELRVWLDGPGWERVHLFLDAKLDWAWLEDGALFDAATLPDKRPRMQRLLSRIAPKRMHDRHFEHGFPPVEPCGEELKEAAA